MAGRPRISEEPSTARSTVVVVSGIAVSRVLGFVRERVIAHFYGVGGPLDALYAAYRVPNLFRNLLGEGSLSVAFVSLLSPLLAQGREDEARRLVRITGSVLLLVVSGLVGLGLLAAPVLGRLVGAGFDPSRMDLTIRLIRLVFPVAGFLILSAWAMGIYHADRRFLIPAVAPSLFSVCEIALIYLLFAKLTEEPIRALALGILVGGAVQFLLHVPRLGRLIHGFRFDLSFDHPAFRKLISLFLPLALVVGVTQVNGLVDTILASFLSSGSIASLQYASRLYLLPLGLFGTSVAMVTLPTIAAEAAVRDRAEVRRELQVAGRRVLFFTLPSSVGLVLFGQPLVRVLFQTGSFGPEESSLVAGVLGMYSLGIVFYALVKLFASGFYALHDTRTPLRFSVTAVGLNTLLSLFLMQFLAVRGIALATAIAGAVNALLLGWGISRRIGSLVGGEELWFVGRLAVGTLGMAGVGLTLERLLPWGWLGSRFGAGLAEVGLFLLVVVAGYLLLGLVLGLRGALKGTRGEQPTPSPLEI